MYFWENLDKITHYNCLQQISIQKRTVKNRKFNSHLAIQTKNHIEVKIVQLSSNGNIKQKKKAWPDVEKGKSGQVLNGHNES